MKGVVKKNQKDVDWKHINPILKFLTNGCSRNQEEKNTKDPAKEESTW